MAEMTYVCKRTVVSTKPVRPNLYYPLSVLDRLMEPRHLRIVFYYRTTLKQEVGELTVKLRESLAETLTSFPIMTGRLQRDNEERWVIKCNDAGVRVVEARASGSIDEWLRDVDREKELRLVHWEEMSHKPYYWSTIYIQMTEFEGGGMAIGLSCIHLLADPLCTTAFIDAWAKTTLIGEIPVPPAFRPLPKRHTLDNHSHANNSLVDYYKTHITKSIPQANMQNHATMTFTFSDPTVRTCIEMAKREGEFDGNEAPSPFEALAGLFWACMSRVKGTKQDLVEICVGSDVRKILGLEEGLFGNCMVYNNARLEINSGGIGLGETARAIREAMSQIDRPNVLGLIEWLEHNDHARSLIKGPDGFLRLSDLVCVDLGDVDPYQARFEDQFDPIRASYYLEPPCETGQIVILPSHDRIMSRIVVVTASKDDLAQLCGDDLVQQLGPTISMGAKFVKL